MELIKTIVHTKGEHAGFTEHVYLEAGKEFHCFSSTVAVEANGRLIPCATFNLQSEC